MHVDAPQIQGVVLIADPSVVAHGAVAHVLDSSVQPSPALVQVAAPQVHGKTSAKEPSLAEHGAKLKHGQKRWELFFEAPQRSPG